MSPPKIVLVDDDSDKRFLLERFLSKHFPENKILAVPSCAEAMPLVQTSEPKIVVTNGRIAGKDGIDFASYVTHEVHAPVVIISLRAEVKQKALDVGVTAFVETGDNEAVRKAVAQALESVQPS